MRRIAPTIRAKVKATYTNWVRVRKRTLRPLKSRNPEQSRTSQCWAKKQVVGKLPLLWIEGL